MKKIESGRSMIEMLGVLAIIGVLSIGGLAGYTMAMNRYRANEILDYARRVAVSAQTRGQGDTAIETAVDCDTIVENEQPPASTTGCQVTFDPSTDTTVVTFTGISDNVQAALENRLDGSRTGLTYNKAEGTFTYAPRAASTSGTGTGTGTGG